jgi:phage baseplate assembly protein W
MDTKLNGFSFPFRIDPATGGVGWASEADKIRQNILLILGTRLGERTMLRNFGTRLPSLVHEPNDDVLAELVESQAREALLQWEPRILVQSAKVERTEGLLRVSLTYIYVNQGTTDQMSFSLG